MTMFMGTTDVTQDIVATPANLTAGLDSKYIDYSIQGLDVIDNIDNGSDYSIVFSPGKCVDNTGVFVINFFNAATTVPAGGFNKKVNTGAFAKGSGNNGYVGSASFTTHQAVYIFAIHFSDDNSCDIAFDDNKAGTNVAAISDVDYIRRIGWFYSFAVTAINEFRSVGNHFYNYKRVPATLGTLVATESSHIFSGGAVDTSWPNNIKNIIAFMEATIVPTSTDTDWYGIFGSNTYPSISAPSIGNYHIARESSVDTKRRTDRVQVMLTGGGTNSLELRLGGALSNGSLSVTVCPLGFVDSRLPWNDL